MPRCDMCFKEKSGLQQPVQRFPATVCKGCYYEIDRVIGFLAHYGFVYTGQTALPLKAKRVRVKKETPKTEDKSPNT